jgi:hypothetical protein
MQIYLSGDRGDLNGLIAQANEDLESIVRWSTENGLLLSPTKSQAVLVSNFFPTVPLPILFLGGVALEWYRMWSKISKICFKVYAVYQTLHRLRLLL